MAKGKEIEQLTPLEDQQAPAHQSEGEIPVGTNIDNQDTKASGDTSPEGQKDIGQEAEAATDHETQQQALLIQKEAEKEKLMAEFKAETDSTVKFKKLEELVRSGDFSDKEINDLQQEIDISLQPKEPGFLEKLGEKPYSALGIESVSSTIKTLTGAGIIVGGVYAGYRAARWLFGWGKDSSEKTEEKKEKGDSWFSGNIWSFAKKAALFGFGGFVLVRLLMGIDSVEDAWKSFKNRFNKNILGKEVTPEDQVDTNMKNNPLEDTKANAEVFAQELDPAKREKYNTITECINEHYKNTLNTQENIFGGHNFDKQKDKNNQEVDAQGMLLRTLTVKYPTMREMVGEWGFYNEFYEKDSASAYSAVWKWLGDKASTILGPLYSAYNGVAGRFDSDGSINEVGKNAIENDTAKKEILNRVVNGAHASQGAVIDAIQKYEYKIAENRISISNKGFAGLSSEDKIDTIEEWLDDDKNSKEVEKEKEKLLSGGSENGLFLLNDQGLINGEVDKITAEEIDANQKKNKEIFGYEDESKKTSGERLQQKMEKKESLNQDDTQELYTVCQNREEQIEEFGDEKRIAPLFSIGEFTPAIRTNDSQFLEDIKRESGWFEIVKEYKDIIEKIKSKVDNKQEVTLDDIKTMNNKIKEYQEMTDEILKKSNDAAKAHEVDGSYVVSMHRVCNRGKDSFVSGWSMIIDKETGVITKIGGGLKLIKGGIATAIGTAGERSEKLALEIGLPKGAGALGGVLVASGLIYYPMKKPINRTVKFTLKQGRKSGKRLSIKGGRLAGKSWAFTGPEGQRAFYKAVDEGTMSWSSIKRTLLKERWSGTHMYSSFSDFVSKRIFAGQNVNYSENILAMLYDGSKVQRRLLLQGGQQARQAYQSFETFAATNVDLLTKKQPPRLYALYKSIIDNTGITDYGKLSTILKNADEYASLVDKAGYKTLQQAINKNVSALLGGQTTLDDILKSNNMGDLIDLKAIQKSIISDSNIAFNAVGQNLKAIEQELIDLNKNSKNISKEALSDALAAKNAEKAFAENAQKNIKQLEKAIASGGGDMKYIKQLEKLIAQGMPIETVADIYTIIRAQPGKADDIFKSIEKGIAGSRDEFKGFIPNHIKLGKNIDIFADDLRKCIKAVGRNSDEMMDGLRVAIKGFSKAMAAIT